MATESTQPQIRAGRPWRREAWLAAGLFVATLLLFWRAVPHDFINFDDPDYVTENPHITGGLTGEGIRWAFSTGEVSYWHPLTWLSHMADCSLFGLNPRGHHATSVVLHALNAALAFLVLRRLTGRVLLAAFAAALFAWHPLRVESVAWVAERKDVLGMFFTLATIGVYAGYARRRDAAKAGVWRWYAGVVVLFAAGLMSKPMVVSIPVLLLVLDFWPLQRFERGRIIRLVLEKLPLFALSAVVSCVTYVAQKNVGTVSNVMAFDARLANAVVSVARYLGRIFLPRDLAVLYPHPGHWPVAMVMFSVLLFVGMTAVAAWQRRQRPWLLAGWLWFVVGLLPASGLVQVGMQAMADRYTYLPSLGITIAVLWTFHEWVRCAPARAAWNLSAAAVLVGLAVSTWNQLGVWSNSLTLFHHAIAVAGEGNYLAYNNRGVFLYQHGRIDEAIAGYKRAMEIYPKYTDAILNLGDALAKKGQREEAIAYYRKALELRPNFFEAHNNLADVLGETGAMPEALEHLEAALRLRPRSTLALNNYGANLGRAGRLDEALARLREADAINPRHPGLQANLGNVLALMGKIDEAVARYRRAIDVDPKDTSAHFNLGYLYFQRGRFVEAIPELQCAIELVGPNSTRCALLGRALVEAGRHDEGVSHLREALRLDSKNPQAYLWLAEAMRANPGRGPLK